MEKTRCDGTLTKSIRVQTLPDGIMSWVINLQIISTLSVGREGEPVTFATKLHSQVFSDANSILNLIYKRDVLTLRQKGLTFGGRDFE
jgi:hypothetical protein